MKIYEVEGKTKELALENALAEANATKEEIFIRTEEIAGSLLKKTKFIAKVITKEDVKIEIGNFMTGLAKNMNMKITTEIEEEDNIFKIYLDSDNNSILIGKDGRTLKAIQVLLRQNFLKKTGFNLKINVDVSGYREKKLKHLENTVKKIAKEVIQSKIDAKLDPMNSYERRFVHNVINDYTMLETKSEGEEPNRYVVISYKQD